MFESKLNRYLKKRLGVLLKNDTIIDDKLLLKLYCTFWLNDGNESDFGANVWIDLDVAHEDYFSLSQEVLTMEFFEQYTAGISSYQIEPIEKMNF